MTIKELHNKISNFKKATYIIVYALLACISRILLIIIAIISFNQIEKVKINIHDNNLIIRELNYTDTITVGLYFDNAILNQNWLGKVYSKNPTFF